MVPRTDPLPLGFYSYLLRQWTVGNVPNKQNKAYSFLEEEYVAQEEYMSLTLKQSFSSTTSRIGRRMASWLVFYTFV